MSDPHTPYLSSRDRQAITAYEEHCKSHGLPVTEHGRDEWIREWRSLDEEQRQEAVEAQRDADIIERWRPASDKAPQLRRERDPDNDIDR